MRQRHGANACHMHLHPHQDFWIFICTSKNLHELLHHKHSPTGKFVNRDYCRFTSDRSPVTYRPERISSLTKSRSFVWRDLLDVALSKVMNVAVSSQFDRRLATKASLMDLPVDGATVENLERVKLLRTAILHSLGSPRALEGWEATFLPQTTLVRYLRGRYGDIKLRRSCCWILWSGFKSRDTGKSGSESTKWETVLNIRPFSASTVLKVLLDWTSLASLCCTSKLVYKILWIR